MKSTITIKLDADSHKIIDASALIDDALRQVQVQYEATNIRVTFHAAEKRPKPSFPGYVFGEF